jgi:eukaryotic-like serine/threonine-protein kinase
VANAVEKHLSRVLDEERVRGVRRLTVVRLAGAAAGLTTALFAGVLGDDSAWRGTLGPLVAYAGLAIMLFAAVRRSQRLARGFGISVALLDVPAVTLIQYQGMAGAPERFLFGPVLGMYCALVVASALLLSARAVLVTCVAAMAAAALLYRLADAPASEHAIIAIAPLGTASICAFLVGRIRALVVESRKSDLMGKYVLGERIGAGGMAEVFKATYAPEGGFEREVAVKRVLPAYAADLAFIDRFRREAELTARLNHPNVVQVLDFGYHHDTYFLAMELVEGVPLSRLVDRPLPLCVASWIGLQLAEALDYIHTRASPDGRPLGLVHRDLNPPNVLVSKHGEVKLADFGVARAAEGPKMTATGMLVGKRGYLSPEQIRGDSYDGRADLFALGLTLYEALTGRKALDGTSDVAMLKALLEASVPPPSAVRDEVPAPLDAVVVGLLAREPAARTPSAAALKAQLLALSGPAAPYPDGRRLLGEAVQRAMDLPAPAVAVSSHGGDSPTRTSAR